MAKRKCPRDQKVSRIRGADDVVRLLRTLLCDECARGELVLEFDWSMRPVGLAARGVDPDHPALDSLQLALLAEELDACEVVVVTFVDPDRLAPTPADVARFEGLRVECADEGIFLLDHVLVSGHQWRSVAELSGGRDA